MTDNNLSYLISSGLVRSRDGSSLSPSGQPYISLPSPNIQSVKPPPQSNHSQMMEDYNGRELPGPDTSQLARRGALVPPKMDEEEDYDEEVVCCLTTIFLTIQIMYTYNCIVDINITIIKSRFQNNRKKT